MAGPGIALTIPAPLKIVGQIAASNFILPAGAIIREVIIFNTTANAVTGGLKFGTTAGATDVIAAQAVGANSNVFVSDASLLKRIFSQTLAQQIFFDAVAAWNSANVTIWIIYEQLN